MRQLQKWHGAGNDFVVSVGDGVSSLWDGASARAVCHRQLGVGADGLLVADTADGTLTMTLYNADGSIAEMSGNGIRCLVAAYCRATGDDRPVIDVQTMAGRRQVAISLSGTTGSAAVAMGGVTLLAPLPGTLGVASVGNPHVVVRDDASWSDAEREAKAAAWSDSCGGANVEFVRILGRTHIALRVIERGVGWTLACGTGSCASAAVCHSVGLTEQDVIVDNPGGTLSVRFNEQGAVLEGPVTFVADVEWFQA